MRRIQHETAVADRPADPALTGPAGYFTGGNPTGSVPATRVRFWWLNMIQEELMGFLSAAGLTAGSTVLAACRKLFGGEGLLAQNGYMRLPGGLIVQWGSSATTSGGSIALTLPITFPTACIAFVPTDQALSGSDIIPMGAAIVSPSQVNVYYQNNTAGSFYWLALGY